jgi:CRP-like cAMP-binding protein
MKEIIDRLSKISLFKEIKDSKKDLKIVADIIKIKQFKKGQAIIKEGELGSEMYILNKGCVHIDRTTLNDDAYRIVTLAANMNIFFGEQALMNSDKRSATVIAADECEVYVLGQKDFISLGDQHPRIGLGITREISKKLVNDLRKASKDVITLFEALVGELDSDSSEESVDVS